MTIFLYLYLSKLLQRLSFCVQFFSNTTVEIIRVRSGQLQENRRSTARHAHRSNDQRAEQHYGLTAFVDGSIFLPLMLKSMTSNTSIFATWISSLLPVFPSARLCYHCHEPNHRYLECQAPFDQSLSLSFCLISSLCLPIPMANFLITVFMVL